MFTHSFIIIFNKELYKPVKTGISIGIVAVYGLLSLTPKFLSPESNNIIKTPMCIKPTRAKKINRIYILANLRI